MNALVTYHTLAPADEGSLRELYAIYEASIPASERKTYDQLRAMLARPDYRFVLAREGRSGVAVGMAVVFAAEDVALLEYLAVAPDRRSGGVGSALFRHSAALAGGPLLVEVESRGGAGGDRVARGRRVAFYRRLGCRRVAGLAYRLPLPGGPPPMGLFVCAPGGTVGAIPRATVGRYLRTLYVRVYGQSADDPRVAAMLAGLPDPVRLV